MNQKQDLLVKTVRLVSLFEIYQNLLTKKQISYFNLYFNEDLSLQEIAEEFNVSRTAVYDSLKKTISNLNNFETNLKILKFKETLMEEKEKYEKENNKEVINVLNKLIGEW